MEHAGVVEFLRDQHREVVGELIGPQVVFDVEHTPVSACAEPGRAQHMPVRVGAVRSDATAHPHPGAAEHARRRVREWVDHDGGPSGESDLR